MLTHLRFAKLSFGVWTMRMKMSVRKLPLAWGSVKISVLFPGFGRCSMNRNSRFEWLKQRRLSWGWIKIRRNGLRRTTKPR